MEFKTNESKTPLISIITATYNACATLEDLFYSLLPQKTNEIEFIIIDGYSTDKTISLIKKYEKVINYWISEKDNGIYDAWNKGVKAANGEWIMFLGADDKLCPDAINQYLRFINEISNTEVDLVTSKLRMVKQSGEQLRVKGWSWSWPRFLYEMTIAHPGALHSSKLFDTYGLFDTSYKITGDYELLLRPKHNLRTRYMNEITVEMMEGGASDSKMALKEQIRASITSGGLNPIKARANFLYVLAKYILKNSFRKIGINVYMKK